jgi:hypothetical protein
MRPVRARRIAFVEGRHYYRFRGWRADSDVTAMASGFGLACATACCPDGTALFPVLPS